jgi:hypothetical protein
MAKLIKKKGKPMTKKSGAKKGRVMGGKPVKFQAKTFEKAKQEYLNQAKIKEIKYYN